MYQPNPADEVVVDLIEKLAKEAARCTFDSQADQRQRLINQIAQLRASMSPTIVTTEEILNRR
jgi:hypothetical protein